MDNNIIEVKNVSMRFNLASEKTDSLKEYFVKLAKRQLHFDEFFALKDVSFDIKPGESVALIGSNGSGKSTMLKVIAGVLYPSTGYVKVRGSIAPMIELGAGFDADLTARENVYLNGAVMGHDRKYMDSYMEDIIEFSELRDFMDVPVKNFSSGMYARLGFSIATIVKADILICDEILAVGDMAGDSLTGSLYLLSSKPTIFKGLDTERSEGKLVSPLGIAFHHTFLFPSEFGSLRL